MKGMIIRLSISICRPRSITSQLLLKSDARVVSNHAKITCLKNVLIEFSDFVTLYLCVLAPAVAEQYDANPIFRQMYRLYRIWGTIWGTLTVFGPIDLLFGPAKFLVQ